MSKPTLESYLNFNGRCEEALEFYKKALGAEVTMLMRVSDAPQGGECPPDETHKVTPDKIMHSVVRIGESSFMASDCRCAGEPEFRGFSLSLGVKSEDEAKTFFDALADGGSVDMPLGKTFWSPAFGVVTDRFGLSWMVNTIA
jgi:PhnB protein